MSENKEAGSRSSGKQKGSDVPLNGGYVPGQKGYTPIEKYGSTPAGPGADKLPAPPKGGSGVSGYPPAPAKQGNAENTAGSRDADKR